MLPISNGVNVRFKIMISLFLLSFFAMGSGCYAEDPQAIRLPASAPASAATSVTGPWSEGWYQGASGYDQAVVEYKSTHKPMVVYMTTAWCPYCRKFEKEVLSSPLVRDAMKDMIKVMINPESGIREDDLASQYRIRGFPSFFLHLPQSSAVVRLSTGVDPETFVDFFKQALD
ncbi:MAG: thioredoxin family protein [Candidatus Omnitrophota bacterium]